MRRRLGGLACAAVIALLAACSSGGASTASAPLSPATTSAVTHPSAAPPTAAAPTTRATTATTTPPATPALIPQETPDLAATAFFAAWRKGDRKAALVVAIPAAVDAIFMLPAQDYSDRGCQTPLNGVANCAFGIGGQAAIAQVHTVSLAGGWVVQSVVVNGNS